MSDLVKRRLKVYYAHRGKYNRYPVIRIGGDYLQKIGFAIGDSIDVELKSNSIIVTKRAGT